MEGKIKVEVIIRPSKVEGGTKVEINTSSPDGFADPFEAVKGLGHAIAYLDRTHAKTPGEMMIHATEEMEKAFVSVSHQIQHSRSTRPKSIFLGHIQRLLKKS